MLIKKSPHDWYSSYLYEIGYTCSSHQRLTMFLDLFRYSILYLFQVGTFPYFFRVLRLLNFFFLELKFIWLHGWENNIYPHSKAWMLEKKHAPCLQRILKYRYLFIIRVSFLFKQLYKYCYYKKMRPMVFCSWWNN